ncbi:MAG: outer membrane protein, partial [Beijerinckiaceae bacterium]
APEPPPVLQERQQGSWTGVYAGLHAGYSWGTDKTAEFLTANGLFTGLAWAYKANSVVGGVHAGAMYEANRVVVGLEGEFELADTRGGFVDPGGAGFLTNKWRASVRGKAGYSFGRILPFFTFGAAFANLRYDYTNWVGPITETTSSNRIGYTIGMGVSYKVTDSVLASIEYRFTDFGAFYYPSQTAFPILTGRQHPRFNTLRSSVSYKF